MNTNLFPKLKDRPQSEKEITQEIRGYLTMRGIFHWKNWGGPIGEKGISDILGVFRGLAICFEIKTKKGHVSYEQLRFLKRVNSSGGLGLVLRSLEDIIEVVKWLENGKDLSLLREKFSN